MHYNYYNTTTNKNMAVFNELEDLYCFTLITVCLSIIYLYLVYIFRNMFEYQNKTLTIIRGMPGSGKSSLDTSDGVLISLDDYVQNHQYSMRNAHTQSILDCFNYVFTVEHPNIYIEGVFSNKWEYSPFQEIARLAGYKLRLVEMPCESEEEMLSFFEESNYNCLENNESWRSWFSEKIYPHWEDDDCNYQMFSKDEFLSDSESDSDSDSHADSPRPKLKKFSTGSENILNHTRHSRYNLRKRNRVIYSS